MTPTTQDVTAGADDPLDTALIARLANEFFSESTRGPSLPGWIPALPTGTQNKPELSGGYPSASPTTHPPVHAGLQPEATHLPATPGTPSGEHAPGSEDTYPFGEPRCNGNPFSQGDQATPSANIPPRNGSTNISSSLPGYSAETFTPDYYFLRHADSASQSSIPSALVSRFSPNLSVLDIEAIRRDFPALHQSVHGKPLIWLDNAATTQKPQSVIDAIARFYSRDNSNIHRAAHTLAARSTELYENGREKVRQFIGAADSSEIVFVRGTTEAVNLVAQTYGRTHIGQGDEILLTTMEHHANIVPWQMLAEQTGAVLRVAPINDAGELILDQFAALLTSRTKLVAVTQVSNALGTINPVEQLIAMAHSRGVPVLVDGAQSAPHMPVNVQAMDCDFFVFSGHKIFGPTGIGVLYGKAALLEEMPPWQGGGNMIQDVTFEKTTYQGIPQKFEAGTPNIAGVVGLGAAIDYLNQVGIPAIAAYEHELLAYATHALSLVPGLRPIGTAAAKASVLSFVMNGISSESVARHLDRHGIAVRAGHHCAQPTVRRYGLTGTVRPSLAFYNTPDEIDTLVRALRQIRKN